MGRLRWVRVSSLAPPRVGVNFRSSAGPATAQRAKLIAKRKAAYDAVRRETKHGGAPAQFRFDPFGTRCHEQHRRSTNVSRVQDRMALARISPGQRGRMRARRPRIMISISAFPHKRELAWTGRSVATLEPAAGKCSRLFLAANRSRACFACLHTRGYRGYIGALSQNMELSARNGQLGAPNFLSCLPLRLN